MSRTLALLVSLLSAGQAVAQTPGLTLPPSGDNQKAAVTQFVGPVRLQIEYSSPKVHGPNGEDRRGKIWGQLVPYGMANLGFGNGKPAPWRGGANENTVLETSHDILVEGKPLPAGRYGLHFVPGADQWTLILSKNSVSWGSFFYDEAEDALRVPLKPAKHEYREWLTYEFVTRKPTEAVVELQWEDLAVPIKFEVPKIQELYISSLRNDLRSVPGFNWNGFVSAAQYCLQTNSNLEQALEWADAAISRPFIGQSNFTTFSTKAQVLSKLSRQSEADALMKQALQLPTASPSEIHMYGRQLLTSGKKKEAMEVFEFNAKRNGETWPTHVGLARGFSAMGETAKALEHARKALPQAPDNLNKQSLEAMIKSLESGKAIN